MKVLPNWKSIDRARLADMSDWIGMNPERGSEEYESSKLLPGELARWWWDG